MAHATLSIVGLFNFSPSVFDLLALPDGIDRETAINTILFKCGELELLYNEPDFMRAILGTWSRGKHYKWKTLQATTTQEYNPIENYDRKESWSDSETGSTTGSGTNKTMENGREQKKGFEGGDLVTTSGSEGSTDGETTSTGTSATNNSHEGRTHGNIGVTSTQQLLQSERDLAAFSIYDVIAADFAEEFCLYVY